MVQQLVDRRRTDEHRFTLIELLVIIIIIGILAAIAIPVFLAQRERGWRGTVQSDLRNYAILAETHLTDTGSYAGVDTAFPPAARSSDDVTMTVPVMTAATYCIEGFHANNTGEVWSLRPGAGLTEGACAGTTTTVL